MLSGVHVAEADDEQELLNSVLAAAAKLQQLGAKKVLITLGSLSFGGSISISATASCFLSILRDSVKRRAHTLPFRSYTYNPPPSSPAQGT